MDLTPHPKYMQVRLVRLESAGRVRGQRLLLRCAASAGATFRHVAVTRLRGLMRSVALPQLRLALLHRASIQLGVLAS